MTTELLTVEEAARRLKINPQTVRRWIRQGLLPAAKVGRKEWRINAAALPGGEPRPAPSIRDKRASAVERLFALRERLRGRGVSAAELLRESRREREKQGEARYH
jgi:excisionase family DNA binding protein